MADGNEVVLGDFVERHLGGRFQSVQLMGKDEWLPGDRFRDALQGKSAGEALTRRFRENREGDDVVLQESGTTVRWRRAKPDWSPDHENPDRFTTHQTSEDGRHLWSITVERFPGKPERQWGWDVARDNHRISSNTAAGLDFWATARHALAAASAYCSDWDRRHGGT